MSAKWVRADGMVMLWVLEDGIRHACGYDPSPGTAALWVLNAMYEQESPIVEETHDEQHRRRLAAGEVEPWRLGDFDERDHPELTVPGGGLGWADHPGPGWKRLRWHQLAERIGDPIVRLGHDTFYPIPSLRSFPSVKRDGSWPASIQPPTEGSLDWESFRALAAVLCEFSGPETVVYAHWCDAITAEEFTVFEGRLADLEALRLLPFSSSPSNIWPADRSWLLYTDWDLWGTKVTGPAELLARLEADDFLETAWLPDYRLMLDRRET
ncbi:hypothetical protein [Natronoglycomyces albus]|uniref:Uncharacterized protein n=1 Tax=Natronoglycomyces albus TaxID=2811108 RepID=A0A895XRH3_9ACTN|nr:hypothetical protein [Natronoglycomyces albus]QSB04208.1 hypothetical protein JQS30_10335 [Natronoglycomyces albus]